jgi:SAM-dependent methyltransferase
MTSKFPERITWAVGVLSPRAGERILEIGCGTGAAVDLICRTEPKCRVTAIDRSAKMAEAASARNAVHVAAGIAGVINADLLDAELEERSYDKIFLFNLNVFWMDPAAEVAAVKRLLARGGRFFIFHQPPPGSDTTEYASVFEKNLRKNGFNVVNILYAEMEPAPCVCVISQIDER